MTIDDEAAEIRLDVRSLDPHLVLMAQMAPSGGFQEAGRRAGERRQVVQGDSGAREWAGPGILQADPPGETLQLMAETRQLGPDLRLDSLGREEPLQRLGPGSVGDLDPRRSGPPFVGRLGENALQHSGDLVRRSRLRGLDPSRFQAHAEGRPGPERLSAGTGQPSRQADGGHLPRLESPAGEDREDPPVKLHHSLSFHAPGHRPGRKSYLIWVPAGDTVARTARKGGT